MHDPMVVAWEVPLPWPERRKWREKRDAERFGRWGLSRHRRTNAEHLGQPVYRWWRPCGWTLRLAGRSYGLKKFATIWHVEPRGADSGSVCRHYVRSTDPQPSAFRLKLSPFLKSHPPRVVPNDPAAGRPWIADRAWKWHVWHWRVQVHIEQQLRRYFMERCELCGRRYPWGYAPVSHQWDGPGSKWRLRAQRRAYHHECSSLVSLRSSKATDEALICHLFAAVCVLSDKGETEALAWLTDPKARGIEFRESYRLTHLLGYERGENYALVRKGSRG